MKIDKRLQDNTLVKENQEFLDKHIPEYELADETDLPAHGLRKLADLGLKPIRVPIRMNGISSQGEYMQCHWNVKKIVRRYGGKRLIGQEIAHFKECDSIEAFCHSVWITPEQKVVCISKSNYKGDELKKGYIVFVARQIDEIPNILNDPRMHIDFKVRCNMVAGITPWNGPQLALRHRHINHAKSLIGMKMKNNAFARLMKYNSYLGDWKGIASRRG